MANILKPNRRGGFPLDGKGLVKKIAISGEETVDL